jgi:hypothetical protein
MNGVYGISHLYVNPQPHGAVVVSNRLKVNNSYRSINFGDIEFYIDYKVKYLTTQIRRRGQRPAEFAGWMLFISDNQQRHVGNDVESKPDDFVQTKERIIGHVENFTRDLE